MSVTLPLPARTAPASDVDAGHSFTDLHRVDAGGDTLRDGEGPATCVLRSCPADAIAELRAQVRARNAILRGEVAFGNMAKAVKRQLARDPTSYPSDFAARDFLEPERRFRLQRAAKERRILVVVSQLPVFAWWTSHRGLGAIGLAQIIAITGDLSNYASPPKLWKRMALHVVTTEAGSVAARRRKGAAAAEHAFNPFARMVMHQIGDALLKLNKGAWRALYLERKAYELTKLPAVRGRVGWGHKRALRFLEKRVLRDLWRQWRDLANG